MIVQTSCVISVQTLMAAPYNLASGAIVYVKVIAYNSIGDSKESPVGGSAIVILSRSPDSPVLSQNFEISTKT